MEIMFFSVLNIKACFAHVMQHIYKKNLKLKPNFRVFLNLNRTRSR